MRLGERIEKRRREIGISQAALAREVGVSQSTINSLINGNHRSSRVIVQIAHALNTTPSYLMGTTEDPDVAAPLPSPQPTVQHFMMPVAFPAEAALSQMFLGLLLSLEVPNADAIAPELAKLLPTGLQTLRGPLRYEVTADLGEGGAPSEDQRLEQRARQRA